MANYINPFTDIGFKRIFGQEFSKPLLIDFLNNLLIGEKRIVNLKFLDKELPPVFVDDRSLIYDIYCELDDDEKIIVEMQNCEQSYFKRRSIYYVSEAIARQGEKGPKWQYDIKGVYLIAFLNFRRPDIGEEFRTDVMLMNKKSKEIFSDKLRLVYLQLPLFEKGVDECENDFDRWIYVLKNMETIKRLPWAAQNSVFQKLAEIADVSSLTKEERLYYDVALRKYRDTLCVLESAELRGEKRGEERGLAKGLAKGRAEGRAEGLAEGRIEAARNMKAKGLAIDLIAACSGLSPEEIERL